jgi:uncharacterized protein (UPF0548 family)
MKSARYATEASRAHPYGGSVSLTYSEVGATAALPMPGEYSHLRYRVNLGPVAMEPIAEAVETFAMHRAAGIRMETDAARAEPGARVTVVAGFRPLRLVAPCEVVRVFAEPDVRGFAYGTLDGHPERGEEAFLVTRDGADTYFEVRAFSRPARWYTKVAGPLVPLGQRAYAWNLARALRRTFVGRQRNSMAE